MNKFPSSLMSEIRAADLLALYENEKAYGRFMFICYGIAHLLKEKFKFGAEWDGTPVALGEAYDEITIHYGSFGDYYNPLSDQVNAQAFEFMERLGLRVDRDAYNSVGDFFMDRCGVDLAWNGDGPFTVPVWSHDFRAKLLKHIVDMDPHAVFSINLHKPE